MITYKDEILMTLFGGGTLDWEMLEKCEYDFEEVLDYIKGFTTIDEMEFNDILVGMFDMFRSNIQDIVDEKIKEVESELKGLEDYSDEYNGNIDREYTNRILDLREELEKLQNLYAWEDIEYYTNYLDNGIYITDDETRSVYREYLKEEIENENEKLGIAWLDLE